MEPTLYDGQVVLVRWSGGVRKLRRLRPGDVVVVRRPDRPRLVLVKRVRHREPQGWWVEGDNVAASDDSWTFGPVAEDLVLGRVVVRVRPPGLLGRGPRQPRAVPPRSRLR